MIDKRVEVNGLKIYPFASEDELFHLLDTEKKILVAINSKKIKIASDELRQIVNNNIGYVDSAGARIALKFKGVKNPLKIPGCELWLKLIRHFQGQKTFYFIGGSQSVIERTIVKLREDFPKINIVAYRNGYFESEEEKLSLMKDIVGKKPDIVFIAMGSPAQEYLAQEMYGLHPAIYQGLGGSFDVYIGDVRRAPKWFADHNLEGIYRAFLEPRKRIKGVLSDMIFLLKLMCGKY